MPERRKRKYTFRKSEAFPYQSGSIIHEGVKAQRQIARDFDSAFGSKTSRKEDKGIF